MTLEYVGEKNTCVPSSHLPELTEEYHEKSQPEKQAPWPRLISIPPDMKQPIFQSVWSVERFPSRSCCIDFWRKKQRSNLYNLYTLFHKMYTLLTKRLKICTTCLQKIVKQPLPLPCPQQPSTESQSLTGWFQSTSRHSVRCLKLTWTSS